MTYQLAQINVAHMKAPLDDARMAKFVAALEPINTLADASPGFVWRLQDDEGDATSIPVFGDNMLLVNMSVWASVEALQEFVYCSGHAEIMRRRRSWFDKATEAYLALWWVPKGHRPTVAEAESRLKTLRDNGPTHSVFTFGKLFEPPDGA